MDAKIKGYEKSVETSTRCGERGGQAVVDVSKRRDGVIPGMAQEQRRASYVAINLPPITSAAFTSERFCYAARAPRSPTSRRLSDGFSTDRAAFIG